MAGLGDFFNDPDKLAGVSAFLTNFGQGMLAANQQGLSPFVSLAQGFGQGGLGIQQERERRALRRQRQMQERLMAAQVQQAESNLADRQRTDQVYADIADYLRGAPPTEAQGGPVDLVPAGMRPPPTPRNVNDPATRQHIGGLLAQLPGGQGMEQAIELLSSGDPSFNDRFEVIGNKIVDKRTLRVAADLSDPDIQVVNTRTANGDQLTRLMNVNTGEVIATLGQGPTSSNRDTTEEEIRRIMRTQNVDYETAAAIVDGLIKVVTDPITGLSQRVNTATGEGTFIETDVQAPDAPAPVPPQDTLYALAESGLIAGLGPTVTEAAGRVAGQVSIDIGPQTTEARQKVRNEAGNLIRALSINPRFPVAEMNRIREEVQISPALFDSASSLMSRMRAVDTSMRRRLQNEIRAMNDNSLPRKTRQDAASAANSIQNFLAVLGVPSQAEQGSLTPEENDLVNKYVPQ